MEMFVFTGILWKEDNEFSALCPELDVASQGKKHRLKRARICSKPPRSISKVVLKTACLISDPSQSRKIRGIPFRPSR